MVRDDAEVDTGPPEHHGRIPGLVAELYLGFRRKRRTHGGKDLFLRQPERDEVPLRAVLNGIVSYCNDGRPVDYKYLSGNTK